MTPYEYQTFALSTYCAPDHIDRTDYLHHLLIEEVGKVMSLFAKSMRDGHAVDRDRLVSELGDVLWCVAVTNARYEIYEPLLRWVKIRDTLSVSMGARHRRAVDVLANYQIVNMAEFAHACDPTLTLEKPLRYTPREE